MKFYTKQGNRDLVGNNIPIFFIQDAIKFPDLIHAVKMESDRAFPQAGSAHDTFWDWASLLPETNPHAHVGNVRPCNPPKLSNDGRFWNPHVSIGQREG